MPKPTLEKAAPTIRRWARMEDDALVLGHTTRTGKRLAASVSGLGAACGECTVYPLATGQVNLSLGCKGCRPAMALDESQMLLAAPRSTVVFDILTGTS